MSFEEMIGGLLEEKIAPLVAKVAALEAQNKELVYLLTSNGGERGADLLTKEQVAARLKVTTRTVDRYVESGRLHPPTGIGHGKRWRVQDVRDFGEGVKR